MTAIKFIIQYISQQTKVLMILSMTMLGLSSCEDFVDIDAPNFEVSSDLVYENYNTAEAATLGIYTSAQDVPLFVGGFFGLSTYLATSSDVIEIKFDLFGGYPEFAENRLTVEDPNVASIWKGFYKTIFNSNSVIEGMNNSVSLIESEKNQLLGEALFARAFAHFYLVNLFGDIPYVISTDQDINNTITKDLEEDVYGNIISDLLDAKALLSDTYLNVDRTRPNKSTVSAFLARVYLYNEEWENAEDESSLVIDNIGLYSFETDLASVFLKDSPSTIWQFSTNQLGGNTGLGAAYNVGFSIFSFSDAQLAAFESGDGRLINWTVGVINFSTFGFDTAPQKYKEQNQAGGITTELNKVFRLGEQYLIRAEARAQMTDIMGAQSDLNMIRNRANLDDTPAATKNALLDAISNERQVELFAEFGHRWFDLKRTGRADAVLNVIPHKMGNWQPTDVLFPIPEAEILANENLKPQNDGY